ncbi:hypothetical protein Slala02_60630 [Streptomyces lavendulae subsp. lavendulae]|nr:hypothetical protein Slala01_21260 [Streptomyces lavendulae subsp. lavendulae]GLX30243.1 hypothetical protein Slala02_60630 [Streptomyces lavendulae subsp. lavendulae]
MVQKPSVRPGRSPRARPTGAPQSEREQNRLRSGTSGFSSTAAEGSGRGTSGTLTSPAPSRLRPDEDADEPELRTDTDRVDAEPGSARDSRPDTERREDEDREDRDERADAEERPEPREPAEPPESPCRAALVIPVGGDTSSSAPAATAPTGASPQVSQ